ncbi:hypothetical protein NOC27_1798 [Nitrosococcus oceani AFC27]|nr:hypothetical protein NOC27_1798 [Nitrosococcus oceani AFC27]
MAKRQSQPALLARKLNKIASSYGIREQANNDSTFHPRILRCIFGHPKIRLFLEGVFHRYYNEGLL